MSNDAKYRTDMNAAIDGLLDHGIPESMLAKYRNRYLKAEDIHELLIEAGNFVNKGGE